MPIHQEVTINAAPSEVYDILLSSEKFARMTGGRAAEISAEEGGRATMFGGDIVARNVELVAGKRVVQAWRSGNWPEGIYSLVRFELARDGEGTRVVFDQSGYPDTAEAMLEGGWHQMYWKPMAMMLGG